jgi:hypothetical protein
MVPTSATPAAGLSGFHLFARLWAVAGVFHFLSFAGWRWESWPGLVLGAATIGVLIFPGVWTFAAMVAVDFASVGWFMGVMPNHILFSWVTNGLLLATFVIAWKRRSRNAGDFGAEWFRIFAPWGRMQVGLLYFFAFFHKLNAAYFNPKVSCPAVMLAEVGQRIPVIPTGPVAQTGVIYGTLLAELLIPILLMRPETRLAGLLVGIGFHTLLALHTHVGIYSFSVTMIALFALFLPESWVARLRFPRGVQIGLRLAAVVAAVLFGAWCVRHWLAEGATWNWGRPAFRVGVVATLVYAVSAFGLVLWLGRRFGRELAGALPGEWRRSPGRSVLWLFPAMLVLLGMQPYLGLRTLMCFSMFSNLQTEGGRSNHLLMPNWTQLTGWQQDLVEVVETNDPVLRRIAEENLRVPFMELRRRRSETGAWLRVRFRRAGQAMTFDASDPGTHGAVEPLGWLGRRYCFFRAVEANPRDVRCRW